MGEHKYNPTAIAAKNGELPPKPRKPSKKEREAAALWLMNEGLRKFGIPTLYDLENAVNIERVMNRYEINTK